MDVMPPIDGVTAGALIASRKWNGQENEKWNKKYACSISFLASVSNYLPFYSRSSGTANSSFPVEWSSFHSKLVESFKRLDQIYAKNSIVAKALLKHIDTEVVHLCMLTEAAQEEEMSMAEVAEEQTRKEAASKWIQEQERQKHDDD